MPDAAANQALASAVSEVLETMFFACVYAETAASEEGGRLEARLRFSGGRQGEFRLGISADAARSIAAGFLGLEESEIGAVQVGDVVCEVTNMICGSVLSHVGADLAYDLHPPRLVEPGEAAATPPFRVRSFDLGNGTLTAGIRFEPS
jgi:CheY-specific phosphatase CheX